MSPTKNIVDVVNNSELMITKMADEMSLFKRLYIMYDGIKERRNTVDMRVTTRLKYSLRDI